jgi:hypothetical protein
VRDVLEGAAMAILLLVALLVAYLLAVFLIARADLEVFIQILKSLDGPLF